MSTNINFTFQFDLKCQEPVRNAVLTQGIPLRAGQTVILIHSETVENLQSHTEMGRIRREDQPGMSVALWRLFTLSNIYSYFLHERKKNRKTKSKQVNKKQHHKTNI